MDDGSTWIDGCSEGMGEWQNIPTIIRQAFVHLHATSLRHEEFMSPLMAGEGVPTMEDVNTRCHDMEKSFQEAHIQTQETISTLNDMLGKTDTRFSEILDDLENKVRRKVDILEFEKCENQNMTRDYFEEEIEHYVRRDEVCLLASILPIIAVLPS